MTGKEVLEKKGIKKDNVVGIKVGKKIFDLLTSLPKDVLAELEKAIAENKLDSSNSNVKLIRIDSSDGLDIMRHSCAHALAQSVKRLFPETKLSVGPTTEVGFFYDFYRPQGFSEEDLKKIEEEMKKIKNENLPIRRFELKKEEAIKLYEQKGETFKIEILKEIEDDVVSFYEQGEFLDLCRGPHVPSTGMIGAFKLTSISAVHFRGDENAPQLIRIYGVAFADEEALQNYFKQLEEIKKRDHRKLGKELELFMIDEDEIGPGLVIWLPKGAKIRRKIENFWLKIHEKKGYNLVYTPHIAKINLWKTSGHLDHYRKFMFPPMEWDKEDVKEKKEESKDFERSIGYGGEKTPYQLKPMNCPFHIMIFKSKTRSYRDLPFRLCEFGTVYRYEKSGVLHGLLRVRGFTQDDAHIFLKIDQIEDEVSEILEIIKEILSMFGFSEYMVFLSTRPEEKAGTDDEWDFAEESLKKALERSKLNFEIDPGEGVFYGPKIDLKIKDVLGRVWQCSTVQLDFNLPRKFSAFYIDSDNQRKPVYIIHRAIFGSFERFFGIFIENTAGNFPPYFAPIQCAVISVKENSQDYASFIYNLLSENGLDCELDLETGERLSKRIRNWEVVKVPFMIVIGEKEKEEKTITIREKGGSIKTLSIEEGIKYILSKCITE